MSVAASHQQPLAFLVQFLAAAMTVPRLAGTPAETVSNAVGSARAMFHVVVILLKLAQPPC